jgi:hypothetical protein
VLLAGRHIEVRYTVVDIGEHYSEMMFICAFSTRYELSAMIEGIECRESDLPDPSQFYELGLIRRT